MTNPAQTRRILADALSVLQRVPPNYYDYGKRGEGKGWSNAEAHKAKLIFDITQELDHDES